MSVPMNPAAPPGKQRPGSVTISSYLLFLVAALQVLSLILSLTVIGPVTDVYEEAYADVPEIGGAAGTIGVLSAVVSGGFSLLVAVALVVLALFNNRGKNPARIVTWVLGAVLLCCFGFGLVGQAASSALTMGGTTGPDMPDQAELQRMLEEALPGWYTPVNIGLGVISLLALLVALILLALPASNEYFRKPQAAGQLMPGSMYPGYPQGEPAYPQVPGYPQAPAHPPAPPTSPPAPPAPPAAPPANPPTPPSPPENPPAPPSS